MKTYYVHYHDNGAPRPIEGETIIEAVENNFRAIAEHAEIGNAAGYQLDKVVLEYQPEALGGKGGAALVITAHGSDALLHYDPRTDEPKTTTLWIDGVTPEELPEPDVTTFDGRKFLSTPPSRVATLLRRGERDGDGVFLSTPPSRVATSLMQNLY